MSALEPLDACPDRCRYPGSPGEWKKNPAPVIGTAQRIAIEPGIPRQICMPVFAVVRLHAFHPSTPCPVQGVAVVLQGQGARQRFSYHAPMAAQTQSAGLTERSNGGRTGKAPAPEAS